MALEKVRHIDIVACVAAVDEETARLAASKVQVEYEGLEPIFDMRDGLKNSTDPIHDRGKYHIGSPMFRKSVQRFGRISDLEKSMASYDMIGHLRA